MTNEIRFLSLQLFADGGGEGGDTGVTAGAAAPQAYQGVKSSFGGENPGRKAAPDAGAAEKQADDGAFERLIKGQFKDAYDRRVSDIVQKRLKGARDSETRLSQLTPMLARLAEQYGVDPSDPEALSRAVNQAAEKGQENRETSSQAPSSPTDPPSEAQTRQARLAAEQDRHSRGLEIYGQWLQQAQAAKELYPGLDLQAEARDPAFRQLLCAGVDVASAYLVRHKDEIIPAAMHRAAKAVEQRLAGKLRTEGVRPPENGMRPQGASFARKDVTKMSKADRDAICARAAKGERIRL